MKWVIPDSCKDFQVCFSSDFSSVGAEIVKKNVLMEEISGITHQRRTYELIQQYFLCKAVIFFEFFKETLKMSPKWKQWQIFFFQGGGGGGSKITADGDCSHAIKRCLFLGRKVMTNLDSILKIRDITLPTKVCLVKAMVFPVVMYGCDSWTIKKAEHQII